MSTSISAIGPGAWLDTINAEGVVFQIDGVWTGTLIIEGSNDQVAGSQEPLFVARDDGSVTDSITSTDDYILKVSTRYVRINCLQITGTAVVTAITRAFLADPSTVTLSQAADQASGVGFTTFPQLKMDASKAIFFSDAPLATTGNVSANLALVVNSLDTTGYESIAVQIWGTFTATVTFYASNDNANWTAVAGWPVGGAVVPVTTAAAAGLWSFQAVGKFFRIQVTAYTSGTVQASCVLRAQAGAHADSVATNATVNNAQIAGTNTVTAGVAGLQAVGGNIAPGTAATANPVPMGGVDAGGITRRALTDASGRQISALQSQLFAGQSPQQVPPVAVQDQTYVDGTSMIEILANIATELRIHSYYLQQLPQIMAQPNYKLDEAQDLRPDPQFLNPS